ncbi:hypothetical protein WGF85_24480 [Klebsiella pneumoniae subsp. pneumoniae]
MDYRSALKEGQVEMFQDSHGHRRREDRRTRAAIAVAYTGFPRHRAKNCSDPTSVYSLIKNKMFVFKKQGFECHHSSPFGKSSQKGRAPEEPSLQGKRWKNKSRYLEEY